MARNRQRARDRKAQQQREHIHRENVPPELQHGGEVDEVEASIVAGADGEPGEVDDAAQVCGRALDVLRRPEGLEGSPAAVARHLEAELRGRDSADTLVIVKIKEVAKNRTSVKIRYGLNPDLPSAQKLYEAILKHL